MFDLAVAPHFWAKVEIDLPGDFDTRIKGDFKAKYKRLETEEHTRFMQWINQARMARVAEAIGAAPGTAGEAAPAAAAIVDGQGKPYGECNDRTILDRVLLDWDDLQMNGQALTFTKDNVEVAERVFGVRAALVVAFFNHGKEAAQGNSAAPPATSSVK